MMPPLTFGRALRRGLATSLATLALATPLVRAVAPPPATEIPNTARVDYDAAGVLPWSLNSNRVSAFLSTSVSANFSLLDDQAQIVNPGTTVFLPHTLTNLGVAAGTYQMGFQNLGSDGYDLTGLTLVRDLNGNGRIDPGEPVIAPGDTLTLAAGQIVKLVLSGTVPLGLPQGAFARAEVSATDIATTFRLFNTDTITIQTPRLSLAKSASVATTTRGGAVIFTLTGANTGGTAAPLPVTVDGAPTALALVRDTLPANTVFSRFTSTGGGLALYQVAGEDIHTWHSGTPPNPAAASAVAVGFPNIPASGTFGFAFEVTVSAVASGPITNLGQIYTSNGPDPVITDSNPVLVNLPTVPPEITYYHDDTFTQETHIGVLGRPLHVSTNAGACNHDPLTIETITVTIESALTHDRESYTAVETGPNTGVFVVRNVPTADAAKNAVVLGDGTLQSLPRDSLTATLEGCGGTVTAVLLIDPSGVVFDSQTCQPVAGATVTLIDVTGAGNGGHAGQPAQVFQTDEVTPAPNPVVTGADGIYTFPRVRPSVYRLGVVGPPSSLFPSILPRNCEDIYPTVPGSTGAPFPVDITTGTVFVNIPIDLPNSTRFGLKKTVSRDTVEAGDSVVYTLELTNNTAATLPNTTIEDVLPAGFTYEPGSTFLGGVPGADPAGGRGPRLTFNVGTVAGAATVKVLYRLRVEQDAPTGEAINSAVARTGGLGVQSGVAHARVVVQDGVFTDKGIIVGKIFLDGNRNRVQDPGESGIPGVRLFLEDGTFVVSDSEGKYSFYGIRPIAHVLKVDRTTLPAGSELIALDPRNAGDGGSRFVDLQKGELHKANFAVDASNPTVAAEVARRRKLGEVQVAEIQASLDRRLEADARELPLTDIRSLPAAGVIGSGGSGLAGETNSPAQATNSLLAFTALLPANTLKSTNSSLAPEPVVPLARLPLEKFIAGLTDNTPGFIGLQDGDTVAGRQTSVRIKGPLGAKLVLLLNGTPVAADRLGKKVVDPVHQIEALEFYSLDLRAGANQLELVTSDPFGNVRSRVPVTITAPDQLAKLAVTFSNPEPTADGHTPVRVTVRLLDAAGTPVTARTPLTLEASLARWQAEDLNPAEPGTQVFIEGGRAEFLLLPPDAPGDGRVVISSGAIKRECVVPFLPDLRPLIASGMVEGTLFMRNGADLALRPTSAADAFEEELRELSRDGDLGTHARAAFFIKGKIKGNLLLTAAYDSDKQTRERLFRDIEPDRYYPVYGDSSLRGFDAQSSRRLYVRLDHQRSYLLLGDFETHTEGEQRALGNYQRALNGAHGHLETRRLVADAWAAHDTTAQVIQEIPADGTSGPYNFKSANGLINSERVEILTRDRNQSSLIIRTEPMQRYTDYEFEPFTGRLMFKDPVRALDENLNPRSIRITYEVDVGGDPFWVYGANAQYRVSSRLEVGGSFARDENPADQQELKSANATVKLAGNTYVLGEVAQSDTDLKGSGLAGRVDLRHSDAKTDARIYYAQTENNFVNPGALLTPGRVEAGTKVTRQLTARDNLIVQGLITEDTTSTGGKREGIRADVEHTFAHHIKLELGARHSEETGNPAGFSTRPGALDPSAPGAESVTPFEVNSLRAKLTVPVPHVPDATVFGEYEQDVLVAEQRLAALGGDWQFSTRGRLYARHEFISALGGPFELNQTQQNNTTVVGVETDYLKTGQLFNEYRVRDGMNGREAEAATGVRHRFQLGSGLRLQAGLERITPFDGTTQNQSTAITTGAEYTDNPLWKGTARLELRYADQSDSVLNTLGYARKLSRDWTFLGKTIVYQVDNKAPLTRDTLQARVLTGLAWRQTDRDVWNALAKYEYRYEDGSPFDATLDQVRNVHIFSASANYQPVHDWIFSSRYAFKAVDETVLGLHASYLGQQLGGRVLYEISKRWDAGFGASVGWSRGFGRHEWALGPEVGYNFKTNLRLGVGYNVVGFHDRDLAGDIPTQRGVFLSLRLKFDEDSFGLRALSGNADPQTAEVAR